MADRHDLGSCAERREGSTPSFPTQTKYLKTRIAALKIETTPRDDHQVSIVAEFEPELMEKFKETLES